MLVNNRYKKQDWNFGPAFQVKLIEVKNIHWPGFLFSAASVLFWIGWSLMPEAGVTDTATILHGVKISRNAVFVPVILQILSSVIYTISLLGFVRNASLTRFSFIGITLLCIGAMGMCADAFFHLLAWAMTGSDINIQKDIFSVMDLMQSTSVAMLLPILLSFFLGSTLIVIGLHVQGVISALPAWLHCIAFAGGIVWTSLSRLDESFRFQNFMLIVLGLMAAGQCIAGFQWIGHWRRHKLGNKRAKQSHIVANN